MRRILTLPALLLLGSLTACGANQAHPAMGPQPPPALVAPLEAEPAVPVTSNDTDVAGYIVGLRNFACQARAKFNGLVAWTLGEERPDPNAGRCGGQSAPPPATAAAKKPAPS